MDVKKQITAAFEAELKKKDGDKITVKDLVDACSISRQAFYYHFQDIQNVMEYSLKMHMEESLVKAEDTTEPWQAIKILLDVFVECKGFIKRVKESKNMSHLQNIIIQVVRDYLKKLVDKKSDYIKLAVKDLNTMVDFYACGITSYMFRECEKDGLDTEYLAKGFERMILGQMKLYEN